MRRHQISLPDETSYSVVDMDVAEVGSGKPEVEKVLQELITNGGPGPEGKRTLDQNRATREEAHVLGKRSELV